MDKTSITLSASSDAFSVLSHEMRDELKRHCYRMMGGIQDAEDCVQEALLRGWREFASLRDGAAGRSWLYSIATHVCLDALRTRRRRRTLFGPSLDETEPGTGAWIEPWPDTHQATNHEYRLTMRLAFVSLLHDLSPHARAVLLLHDGVGMTAMEAAKALGISHAAARSALQRARTTLSAKSTDRKPVMAKADNPPLEAYLNAWNDGDVDALIRLLHKDIVLTMPPWQRTFTGYDEVARFLNSVWPRYDGFRAVATSANGQAAVAVYTRRNTEPYLAHSLHILAGAERVREMILYAPPLGNDLFAAFNLAREL